MAALPFPSAELRGYLFHAGEVTVHSLAWEFLWFRPVLVEYVEFGEGGTPILGARHFRGKGWASILVDVRAELGPFFSNALAWLSVLDAWRTPDPFQVRLETHADGYRLYTFRSTTPHSVAVHVGAPMAVDVGTLYGSGKAAPARPGEPLQVQPESMEPQEPGAESQLVGERGKLLKKLLQLEGYLLQASLAEFRTEFHAVRWEDSVLHIDCGKSAASPRITMRA